MLWALLLLPWIVALVLVRRHDHLDVAAVTVLFAVSLGLPTLWVTWAAYRGPRRSGTPVSGLSIAQVADKLAVAVGAQWSAEAAVRRLNDPYPLPVSWAAADAYLTDAWDSLLKLRTSGAGWPPPPAAQSWAAGPDDLAGEGGKLAEVLAWVPTGRLVVLGEPGAGKTMLMVRLVLDLLARRASGSPVPFLASVASWNPVGQDLRGWLSERLQIDHPALADPPSADRTESTQAAALLAAGLILPILDGLDEIPEEFRGSAISRINDMLRPGEQLVVTCRSQQYREAVRPRSGVEVTLRAAAAVQLRPLDADAVRDYLCDDAAGPVAKARWDPVLAVLDSEAPAGQALRTPLMVGLARAIYNPRPGELTGALRDPVEMCNPALADRAEVESLLFDAFIPAAYRQDPAGRWTTQDVEKWLAFLARHLEHTIGGPDLAWWQLSQAVPGFALATGVGVGVLTGAAVGIVLGILAGALFGALAGIVTGALTLVAGLAAGPMLSAIGVGWWPKPVRGIRMRPPERSIAVVGVGVGVAGVVAGITLGVVAGAPTRIVGIVAAVGVGLGAALVTMEWLGELNGAPLDLGAAVTPLTVLVGDRRTATALAAMNGVVAGIFAGIVAGVLAGAGAGIAAAIAAMFGFGVVDVVEAAAWPSYGMARIWLALRHRLPWPLMGFLADAHMRGVLRQAGAVYQFRHIDLQHRLASPDRNNILGP